MTCKAFILRLIVIEFTMMSIVFMLGGEPVLIIIGILLTLASYVLSLTVYKAYIPPKDQRHFKYILIILVIVWGVIAFAPAVKWFGSSENDSVYVSQDPNNNDDVQYLGSVEGYHFYEYQGPLCLNELVEDIIVEGFNFGNSLGCEENLDWIGYVVIRDGEILSLQELVDNNEIHTWRVYFKIHLWYRNK